MSDNVLQLVCGAWTNLGVCVTLVYCGPFPSWDDSSWCIFYYFLSWGKPTATLGILYLNFWLNIGHSMDWWMLGGQGLFAIKEWTSNQSNNIQDLRIQPLWATAALPPNNVLIQRSEFSHWHIYADVVWRQHWECENLYGNEVDQSRNASATARDWHGTRHIGPKQWTDSAGKRELFHGPIENCRPIGTFE